MSPTSLIVLSSLFLAACSATPGPSAPAAEDTPAVAVGQRAPGFELPDENEETHTLDSLHDDQYVVLSFSRAHW